MDVPVKDKTKSAKILLVDDKDQNLFSIESILEHDGYTFVRAGSGNEALKILLKEDDFALILMDVNMPGLNGYETASLIYSREKLNHIPIIFITAYDYNEENVFQGYKSGGVDYIFKPINSQLLKIKVKIFVELFSKNRQLRLQEEKLKSINKELQNKIEENSAITQELEFRNMQLLLAQKLTHVGNWQWNILDNKLSGSKEIFNIYEIGYDETEFTVDQMLQRVHPDDIAEVRNVLTNSISEGVPFDIYFRIVSSSGDTKFVNKKGTAVTNEKNELVKILGTCQDVTKLKIAEEQLKIFNMLEKVLNEIYIFDSADFKITYANAYGLKNLGYKLEEITHLNIFDILHEMKSSGLKKRIFPLLHNSKEKVFLFSSFKRKDGSEYPVEIHLQLVEQGNSKVFLAVVLDLTERKKTEQILTASLKEKETLLKEIHHRVKNNLQIIYSLINLQCSSTTDEKVVGILKESQNRIRSMALIHEKLYQHNDLSRIDFSDYLNDLVISLSNTYRMNTEEIKTIIDAENVYLSIDIAISLGLCVTELITNSYKYAFPGGMGGEVTLKLRSENKNLLLTVSDNGIGLPEEFDIHTSESLGLKIVSTLVDQHYGKLKVNRKNATEFKIIIPLEKPVVERVLNLVS
jgi:PAS domain S-box-containing protein